MEYERLLKENGQGHLWEHYLSLSAREKEAFSAQLAQIDWQTFARSGKAPPRSGEISPIEGCARADAEARREEYFKIGKEALRGGKLACVMLAGGQGTRLGSSSPKGAYDLGITRPVYIFERQIANLLETCSACGCFVPLCIMTSTENDEETRAFLHGHAFFGYPERYVRFFVQDMAPCTDLEGKIILEARGKLALSPNGNGGWYSSLVRAELLRDELLSAAEWFNVFAVDNVLQRIADPVFLGATISSGRRCGAKVVRKTCPEERVGVLCLRGGKPDVVEYYEIDPATAALKDGRGGLLYPYGVILNYLFRADSLGEMLSCEFPLHKAKKRVPYLGENGETVIPDKENAYKSETLILDMVRLAGSCLPFEVEREREFAPVKNRTGTDSAESARELLKRNGVEL